MKKFIIAFTFLVFSIFVSAQPPAGYYDAAAGLTGLPLKTALYNIIKGHTSISYSGLYAAYVTTDNFPGNKVYDMYSIRADSTANYWFSNSASSADQCGNYSQEGDCYNREHSTPASWFNDATPMYSDLFNVYPTDGYVNNNRSNYPFADVGTANYTSSNGSKRGTCATAGYSGTVFEPIDCYKGDFARTYLYMATRYENIVAGWPSYSTECAAVYAGNGGLVFKPWYVTMLLNWCAMDSVSQKEIARNNAVYAIQHNRNPYIDHPEWIWAIWGPTSGIAQQSDMVNVSVFPNPVSDMLTIENYDSENRLDKIEIYSFTSSLVQIIDEPAASQTINVSNFSEGLYTLVIYSGDKISRKKVVVIH
jgi:endonuclease I